MIGPKQIDELSRRIFDNLPGGLGTIHEDMRQNLRAALAGALARMELVTREEFDVQRGVLARTREKVERLEQQLAELERRVDQAP